jgi:hypothetical protein
MIDHDRLFKELLTTFFAEFVDLFLPDVAAYLDHSSLTFLDKEVFTDVTSGERHEADIVARARFRDEDAFFLVHVENQATPQAEFGQRMFRYFARLYEKHGLPVYPVVVFSYDAPPGAGPLRRHVPRLHAAAIPLSRDPIEQAVVADVRESPEPGSQRAYGEDADRAPRSRSCKIGVSTTAGNAAAGPRPDAAHLRLRRHLFAA